jgi:NAD(P)-dependent dehydrogenase (short-subunit alcohol dehydrogenase family)
MIGQTIACGLAEVGPSVVASSGAEASTLSMTNAIRSLGVENMAQTVDVTSRRSIQDLHDGVIARFGHVDVLVNCAGMTERIPTLDSGEAIWNKVFDVNLLGTLRAWSSASQWLKGARGE